MRNSRITSITIENFKGISKPVTVNLKPITLLFGKNSAGKSTILQAMLYALELIRTGEADIDTVQLGGDAVHLGGFKNLVHKHDVSKTVRLRFDLQLGEFGLESFDKYDGLFDDLENDALGNVESVFVEFEIAVVTDKPEIVRYTTGIDGEAIASIEGHAFVHEISDVNYIHPIFVNSEPGDLVNSLCDYWCHDVSEVDLKSLSTEEKETMRGELSENIPYLCASMLRMFDGGIPPLNHPLDFLNEDEDEDGYKYFDDSLMYQRKAIELFFSRCLVRPLDVLFDHLSRMRYVGPIRDIPNRNHESPIFGDGSRWSNVLAAWDILYNSFGDFSSKILCNISLIVKTNLYLLDKLELGYEIQPQEFVELDINGPMMNLFRKVAL